MKHKVIQELDGLLEQASKERSHYYVQSVCEFAKEELQRLYKVESKYLKLRAEVDKRISEEGV
jgi:hypothetical protein